MCFVLFSFFFFLKWIPNIHTYLGWCFLIFINNQFLLNMSAFHSTWKVVLSTEQESPSPGIDSTTELLCPQVLHFHTVQPKTKQHLKNVKIKYSSTRNWVSSFIFFFLLLPPYHVWKFRNYHFAFWHSYCSKTTTPPPKKSDYLRSIKSVWFPSLADWHSSIPHFTLRNLALSKI